MPQFGSALPWALLVTTLLPATEALNGQLLLEGFDSQSPAVRQEWLQHLASLPAAQKAAYVLPLVQRLKNVSPRDASDPRSIIPAFARIGPLAARQLAPLLDESNPRTVRVLAAQAVAITRPTDPAVIEKLQTMMGDQELWVRARAAESILSMDLLNGTSVNATAGDHRAEAIIREEARGNGEPVSAEDLVARFSRLGPVSDKMIQDWIKDLSSDESFTVYSAVGSLSLVGVRAVPPLLAALKSETRMCGRARCRLCKGCICIDPTSPRRPFKL